MSNYTKLNDDHSGRVTRDQPSGENLDTRSTGDILIRLPSQPPNYDESTQDTHGGHNDHNDHNDTVTPSGSYLFPQTFDRRNVNGDGNEKEVEMASIPTPGSLYFLIMSPNNSKYWIAYPHQSEAILESIKTGQSYRNLSYRGRKFEIIHEDGCLYLIDGEKMRIVPTFVKNKNEEQLITQLVEGGKDIQNTPDDLKIYDRIKSMYQTSFDKECEKILVEGNRPQRWLFPTEQQTTAYEEIKNKTTDCVISFKNSVVHKGRTRYFDSRISYINGEYCIINEKTTKTRKALGVTFRF